MIPASSYYCCVINRRAWLLNQNLKPYDPGTIWLTDTSRSLSIKHSNSIQSIIIHTSSYLRSPNGDVQNKPSVTGISGHSTQIIVRCVVWSVSDDSIGNSRYRGTLNGCVGIIIWLYACCEQAQQLERHPWGTKFWPLYKGGLYWGVVLYTNWSFGTWFLGRFLYRSGLYSVVAVKSALPIHFGPCLLNTPSASLSKSSTQVLVTDPPMERSRANPALQA